MSNSKKILVAMSGGIDSSMSAKLLRDTGHDISGVYMKLHPDEEYHSANIKKIEKVCEYLNINFFVLDRVREFQKTVIDKFVQMYKDGITPNPCSFCNREMKFGDLMAYAISNGFDALATGHYVKCDGKFFYEAEDKTKDQSYFLFNVKPENLSKIIFPLSGLNKADLKDMAAKLPEFAFLSKQKESSEICFVENDYIDVLKKYIEVDGAGEVVDENLQIVGKHKGYMNYTIGKRKGFDVPLSEIPLYVKRIIPEKNQIMVAPRDMVFSNVATLKNLNMFEELNMFECDAKVRYRSHKEKAFVSIIDGIATVKFSNPQFAIAKGQACVFYIDDKMIGGGYIS